MLSFTVEPQDLVTPFFVTKKNKRLRFILDCRGVNRRFKKPPSLALAAGSTWSQVVIPEGQELFVAQSDIKDYFYSLALPTALQPLFCLPAIRFGLLQEWGITGLEAMSQGGSAQEGLVFPMVQVVPMGWSWAMWLAQRAHQNISLIASGLPVDHVVVEGRPVPDLTDGNPVIIPYADNLNVAGTNACKVQLVKDAVVEALRGYGFRVHEELDASSTAQSLGFLIDGKQGVLTPVPDKHCKVVQAFEWLSRRPKV